MANLVDIATPGRILQQFQRQQSLVPESLFDSRLAKVVMVKLEQYEHTIPKALVVLWQVRYRHISLTNYCDDKMNIANTFEGYNLK